MSHKATRLPAPVSCHVLFQLVSVRERRGRRRTGRSRPAPRSPWPGRGRRSATFRRLTGLAEVVCGRRGSNPRWASFKDGASSAGLRPLGRGAAWVRDGGGITVLPLMRRPGAAAQSVLPSWGMAGWGTRAGAPQPAALGREERSASAARTPSGGSLRLAEDVGGCVLGCRGAGGRLSVPVARVVVTAAGCGGGLKDADGRLPDKPRAAGTAG
jgi:hypothetical protein